MRGQPGHLPTTIKLWHDEQGHTVALDSRRYCDGCRFWELGHCRLFELKLPPYASPARPALCLSAEEKARENSASG